MTASAGREARQGDVLISSPSPLTGESELYVVVSADVYNAAGAPTVLVAEIETGTRYRASAYATETDYGVVPTAWSGCPSTCWEKSSAG